MNKNEFSKALGELIRDELLSGNLVKIDGLGAFSRRHIPAEEETQPDGTILLHPPKDTIRFEPDEETL